MVQATGRVGSGLQSGAQGMELISRGESPGCWTDSRGSQEGSSTGSSVPFQTSGLNCPSSHQSRSACPCLLAHFPTAVHLNSFVFQNVGVRIFSPWSPKKSLICGNATTQSFDQYFWLKYPFGWNVWGVYYKFTIPLAALHWAWSYK